MRMRTERQDVGRFLDRWKRIAAEHLDRRASQKIREVELNDLSEAGKVYHDEDGFVSVATQERQHFWIVGEKEMECAARERFEIFPHPDDTTHPPEQRRQIL